MAFEVECQRCSARFTLPQELYERKVKGRVVTVRCKRCRANITVDGTRLVSRPGHDAPLEETPTVPIAATTTFPVDGLWVVSFADDDDRELTVSQIERALEAREIDQETLVWNSSMDEWRALREVPALASLLERVARHDATGGFLGTGVSVRATVTEPALRPSSRPPPAPGAEENALLGEDEIGPFRSESAGTFHIGEEEASGSESEPIELGDEAETEPIPPVRQVTEPAAIEIESDASRSSHPPKKPDRRTPEVPPEPIITDNPENPHPVSATPDLRTLVLQAKSQPRDKRDIGGVASEDIFNVGSKSATTQLPTIDLDELPEAPPSSDKKAKPEPKPEPKAEEEEKPRRGPPPPPKRGPRSTPAATASAVKSEPPPASSPMTTWLIVGAIALAAGWYFFIRPKQSATPAEPTPSAIRSEPPAVTTTSATEPLPERPTPSASGVSSAMPSASSAAATRDRDATDKPKDNTSAPVESGKEVDMKPPFDASAASAAVDAAAIQARSCRRGDDPSGQTSVIITFAPTGRVTTATVNGPPYQGTLTGGCIASTMRTAKVPAFSGDAKTVSKLVIIQ